MARDESTLCMRLVQKTAAAVKVSDSKRPPEHGQAMFFHWLPRSMISYSRTEPSPVEGEFPIFTFKLPDWKIEQTGLDKFIVS